MKNKLLIVTAKEDVHVDYMIQAIQARGFQDCVVRLNTEDLLRNTTFTFDQGSFKMKLSDSGREFTDSQIGCVWYRKPHDVTVPDLFEEDARDLVEGTAETVLQGIYYLMTESAVWINPRKTAQYSSNKLKQTQVAELIGFNVPRTIITNDLSEALAFVEMTGKVCTKDFDTSGRNSYRGEPTFTVVLEKSEIRDMIKTVEFCPTLFQEYIEKAFDLRVTVIGEAMYGVEIHSQDHKESEIDFRIVAPDRIKHVEHSIPDALRQQILAYMHQYDLVYSALDFAVTPDGRYFFLENNPNGQWLWQELLCSVRISDGFMKFFQSTLEW